MMAVRGELMMFDDGLHGSVFRVGGTVGTPMFTMKWTIQFF